MNYNFGKCKGSADNNMPDCAAAPKNKKLPRNPPRPHQAPNQAAFSLQIDLTTDVFFAVVGYRLQKSKQLN